jgi:hypothetical protein
MFMVQPAVAVRNEKVLMDYRKIAEQWRARGVTRNEILLHLFRTNAERNRPVGDEEVLELVRHVTEGPPPPNKPPSKGEDVTEERERRRNSEETDRNRPKASESERGDAPPPRGGATEQGQQQPKKPTTSLDAFRADLEAGVPSTLSFQEYLLHAVREYRRHVEEDAPPEWQVLFYFVRLVQAHPATAGQSGKQAFCEVCKVVREWLRYKGGQVADGWQYWLGVDYNDVETIFLDAWDKVRYVPGRSPLTNALERARRNPVILPNELADKRPDVYPMFVSLAGWLQVVVGDQPIKLPVREVGELLRVLPMTVSRLRKFAVKDGFLKEIKPHRYAGRRGAGEATSFRFDVSRVPLLREKAQ